MAQFRVTATALNVRRMPSTQEAIIGTLFQDDIVERLEISSDQKWYKIQKGDLIGWSAQKFLVEFEPEQPVGTLDSIVQMAGTSAIATFSWPGRGVAPRGYIKGMALAYGRCYCKLRTGDAGTEDMAKADTGDATKDALAHYADEFDALGMSNEASGATTLRHLFVLLLGLGMRESSGRYCEGRDRSAHNTTARTAEAGLFQTSFDATDAAPTLLGATFDHYLANPEGFLDVFKEGVRPTANDLQNFGAGRGKEFQRLSKESPAFAVEFAAIGLRHLRKHWGPVNTRAAELRPEADRMFLRVQTIVDASDLCGALV